MTTATAPPDLPAQHTTGPYRVTLVCLGNICRSPIAAVVLTGHLDRAGLGERVRVDSSGTGDWHMGMPMDERAAAVLAGAGYDATRHRATRFTADLAGVHDLVLAMDARNLKDLHRLGAGRRAGPDGAGDEDRLRRYRDFDPAGRGDVPDPFYGGPDGFDEVLAMVERTSAVLVRSLQSLPPGSGAAPPHAAPDLREVPR